MSETTGPWEYGPSAATASGQILARRGCRVHTALRYIQSDPSTGMGPRERVLLLAVAWHADLGTDELYAREAGVSRKTVRTMLRGLVQREWLQDARTEEQRAGGHRPSWTLGRALLDAAAELERRQLAQPERIVL